MKKDSSEILRWWSDALVQGHSQLGSKFASLFKTEKNNSFTSSYKWISGFNIYDNYNEPLKGIQGGFNLDSKAKRNQVIQTKSLALRLTNATFFEVVGWKRIPFFLNALKEFGFDPDSAELNFEEVELPISIGNGQINNFQLGSNFAYKSHGKTFLVRKYKYIV